MLVLYYSSWDDKKKSFKQTENEKQSLKVVGKVYLTQTPTGGLSQCFSEKRD